MAKSLPPLNWFRAFEAAARNLSFTAAAEEIGMTQSAVSQQIKSLEVRLGVPLFERKARGLALTDDGRRLLPQVELALETLGRATEAFLPERPEKLLTVSASISVIEWLISPRLPDFRERCPDIGLRFISAIWPDEFSRTVADVVIRFGSRKQAGANADLLGTDRLVTLKAPALEGRIEELPLIETVGTSTGWKTWGERAGYKALKPALFVDSFGLALRLAADGNGVCLVNEVLAGGALGQGRIETAHPVTISSNENYYVSIENASPDARAFADWIGVLARSGASS